MLKTKVTRVNRPAYPAIDVHNHLGGGAETLTKERVDRYLQDMDDAGVRTVVNLDGRTPPGSLALALPPSSVPNEIGGRRGTRTPDFMGVIHAL